MIGNSDNETNFPHELLLTNRQVAILRKTFTNYLLTDIKLSKTQLSKMIQSGRFLGRLLGPLLKPGLPLIKNAIEPLAKSVLIPLGLATDAGVHIKFLSSESTTLIISNEELEDIMKIVKSLKDSGLLLNRISETIQNEPKERKGGFLDMFLGTLGASLLGSMLTGTGITRAGYGSEGSSIKYLQSKDLQFNKGKGIKRADYGSKGYSIKDF